MHNHVLFIPLSHPARAPREELQGSVLFSLTVSSAERITSGEKKTWKIGQPWVLLHNNMSHRNVNEKLWSLFTIKKEVLIFESNPCRAFVSVSLNVNQNSESLFFMAVAYFLPWKAACSCTVTSTHFYVLVTALWYNSFCVSLKGAAVGTR